MKKTILILTTFYEPFIGGAEIAVKEIVKRLHNDFNFIIITGRYKKSLPKEEYINGIKIYRVGIGCKYDKFFYPFLSSIKSFSIKFDLSYAIMASYAGAAAVFIKTFRGKPYVLNLQSGTMETEDYVKIIKFFQPFYKRIYTGAEKIHAISISLKERAERLGVITEKIYVIPNGIDLEKFRSINNQKHSKMIITVANLKKVKGLDHLIKAASLVTAKYPDTEFIIVGEGEERKSLENLIKKIKLEEHVKLVGAIDHNKIPKLLNLGNIFVCPSLAEGFGLVILEAMACGMVVIGSKTGGITDIIQDKYNGLLIDPGDSLAIAQSISYLLENKNQFEKIKNNSLKFVINYDWNKICQKIKILFI
tara:strand:- start:13086 stop:14174 length:1089 start_codon:yes stop_codon:yes gene_type:complete